MRSIVGALPIEGYVEQITLLTILPDATKAAGRLHIVKGMQWFIGAIALALIGKACGLRANGMVIMACVPVLQGIRFYALGGWHLMNARV